MRFAEIVITDQQASMARVVIDTAMDDPERFVMTDEERTEYERLAVFLGQVAQSPESFPLRPESAKSVRAMVRRAKGPAKPARKPKRHARREQRQSRQKFLRKNRSEFAAQYNEALAKVEADMAEAAEIQRETEERIATQPKFTIKGSDGRMILSEIPAEAILNAEGESAFPQIILPG